MLSNIYIDILKKSSQARTASDYKTITSWMMKNFKLFQDISEGVFRDILNNSEILEFEENTMLIKQGEKGSCFYVIISGHVSVYINTDIAVVEVGEDKYVKPLPLGKEKTNNYPRVVDRNKYGNFIGSIEAGNGFGEMALISEDDVRQATIIADGPPTCLLLVLERAVYDRSLRQHQQQEFQAREHFVSVQCPLFRAWPPRFKRQAAMSIRRLQFPFDFDIVQQGEKLDGLRFIVEGQAKVIMDISQHSSQYPQLIIDSTINRSLISARSKKLAETLTKIQNSRKLEVSLVGPGEIIGDIEMTFGLETSYKTVVAVSHTEVYWLNQRNYDRLISAKRNQSTGEMLRRWCERKLLGQATRRVYRQIPLHHSLVQLAMVERTGQSLVLPGALGDNISENAKAHRKQSFALPRGPLIDMFGPGSVFYRNKRLRERNNKRKRHINNGDTDTRIKSGIVVTTPNLAGPCSTISPAILVANMNSNRDEEIRLDREPTILDVESDSRHLDDLENRIVQWHLRDADPVVSKSQVGLTKLQRINVEGEQPPKPGKTIIIKQRNPFSNSIIQAHQRSPGIQTKRLP